MINSHLKNDIRYITINRAEKANAITSEMLDELVRIVSQSNKNKAVIKLFIKYQLLKRLKTLEFRVYLIIIRI